MRYSGIGGQAVMEGVMMKNGGQYAVAVRKPDGEIIVDTREYKGILPDTKIKNVPFARGVVNFIESLVVGMRTLMYSASFYEEGEAADDKAGKAANEEGKRADENKEAPATTETRNICNEEGKRADENKEGREKGQDPGRKQEEGSLAMGITMACSVAVAVAVFMLLPFFVAGFFKKWVSSYIILAILEGGLRMAIFFAYILLISRIEDIQRVFMYHGAEHKCINCIEHGMELNVENVRKSSRLHKRCGTSFLFLVVCISMVFFLFIRTDSGLMRIVVRLLLVPVIAGCAYESIRLAGRSEGAWMDALSRPGMALQKLTTKEPDDSMIEVGIASVEAVFDWKAFLAEKEEA